MWILPFGEILSCLEECEMRLINECEHAQSVCTISITDRLEVITDTSFLSMSHNISLMFIF